MGLIIFLMHSRSLIIPIALVAFVVGALHLLAIGFYLYWMWWWFDIIVHFFAGVWVALTAFWFLFIARLVPRLPLSTGAMVGSLLLVTFFIGISWETFEYSINVFIVPHYALDTIVDLIADLVGALAAALFVSKSHFGAMLQ